MNIKLGIKFIFLFMFTLIALPGYGYGVYLSDFDRILNSNMQAAAAFRPKSFSR